jgi:hypothetical protein
MTQLTVAQLMEAFDAHVDAYDVGVSVSSFDHDGLGRYGDPLWCVP